MLSMTIRAGEKAGIPVAVCGEIAGDPVLTRLLLGMGLREFSMHPTQLLSVKQEILSSNLKLLTAKTKKILQMTEPDMIEQAVQKLKLL